MKPALSLLLSLIAVMAQAANESPNTDRALEIVGRYKAVFTVPPQRIPSDHVVDAPLLGNGDMLVAMGGKPVKLQFFVNKNDLWRMTRRGPSHPYPLARLDLNVPDLKDASYRVEQDLFHAITTGRFEKDGKSLTVEAAVSAKENLLWIKLSAQGGTFHGQANLQLGGQTEEKTGKPTKDDNAAKVPNPIQSSREQQDGVQCVVRRSENGMMIPAGAACAVRVLGGDWEFVIESGKPVLIVATVASVFDMKDYRKAAIERAKNFQSEEFTAVRKSHEEWWSVFWNKSFVKIPDKFLEQRYYLSQYVLASASRAYDFPPGIFGWITTDTPAWNGDYHMNYNHVAPFYGLYASNHLEQADPCHAPILANREQSIESCRKELHIEGTYQTVGIAPRSSLSETGYWMQKSNSSYSCVPIAFRWYGSYDSTFGREAYPYVRDTATFWENWLKFENGRYVIYDDAIHEGSGNDRNSIVSLSLVRLVINLALDMSQELGIDAGRHEKWRHIRDHLSKYTICKVRDLPNEFLPKHLPQNDATLNLPIFRYTEHGTPWWANNTLGIQHIYPAGGIGLDSDPKQLEIACNQIRVMNRWVDGNGMNSFYAAAARVGYDSNIILNEMHAMVERLGLPNGMIRDNPHGMEHQSIVPNTIQEMLLQSHEGVIRFFPCWPMDQDAQFRTLRARGAFLVSAERKSGVVGGVQITSERGRDCPMLNPWLGRKVQVVRNDRAAEIVAGERFILKTKPGETIELKPEQSTETAVPVKAFGVN